MNEIFKRLVLSIIFGVLLFHPAICQDPRRFQQEIDLIRADTADYSAFSDLVLFTGSSSVRMWTDVQKDFPDLRVVNTGFGGSHMSDLLFYADTLILRYRPKVVFIYEGDNDIADRKEPAEIVRVAGQLVDHIRKELPETVICFFSPKPSILRWNLKDDYLACNQQLKKFTRQHKKVYFLDVWDRMTGIDGKPRSDIFLEDGLHLNRKGYDIWKGEVVVFLRKHEILKL